jgi:PHD/YefM family antitoxin component YafN of YafNO toxin-antitoxin module
MTGLDALQSAQFVTANGKRLVVVNAEDWEAMIEWLETVEDLRIAQEAYDELKAAGGDRERAGWLNWADVKDQLE